MVRRLGLLYDRWLHQAPLLTKALTSATPKSVADRLAQRAEAEMAASAAVPESSEELAIISEVNKEGERDEFLSASTRRTLRMMVWGGCFLAPTLHK